jgi:hypothetical protein
MMIGGSIPDWNNSRHSFSDWLITKHRRALIGWLTYRYAVGEEPVQVGLGYDEAVLLGEGQSHASRGKNAPKKIASHPTPITERKFTGKVLFSYKVLDVVYFLLS